MKFTLPIGALVLLTALPLGARDTLRLTVSPHFAYEPTTVNVEAVVEPDAANRAIDFVADSDDFYRSSRVELDGANAPRITTLRYHDLPAGEYDISVVLYTSNGRTRALAHQSVTVMAR